MVNVAMVTVAAAETEEAIGVGSGSGEDSERCSHDPDLMVRALSSLTNENSVLCLSLSHCSGANQARSCDGVGDPETDSKAAECSGHGVWSRR